MLKNAGDKAIWDRLRLIPFGVRISEAEEDDKLPERLRSELPGVLAWAVRGTLAWKEQGLGVPPEVASAGEEWRAHDDPLREFLEDCTDFGDDAFVPLTDIMAGYLWWCKENGERWPLGRQAFNEHLLAKGFTQRRTRKIDDKQTRTWEGLELKSHVITAIRHQKAPTWQRED